MKLFQKLKSPWLGFLVLACLVVVLGFIFRPGTRGYQLSPNEALNLINDQTNGILSGDLPGKTLVDVRTPEQFLQGHLPNAINIPVRQLLDDESVDFFNNLQEKGLEAVLYGTSELQATGPVFLMNQLGYSNVKLLKGGFSAMNQVREPDPAATEVSVIDTSLIRITPEIKSQVEKPGGASKEKVVRTRKTTTSSGGC